MQLKSFNQNLFWKIPWTIFPEKSSPDKSLRVLSTIDFDHPHFHSLTIWRRKWQTQFLCPAWEPASNAHIWHDQLPSAVAAAGMIISLVRKSACFSFKNELFGHYNHVCICLRWVSYFFSFIVHVFAHVFIPIWQYVVYIKLIDCIMDSMPNNTLYNCH